MASRNCGSIVSRCRGKSLRRERELAFYGDIDFIPTEEYTEAHGRAAYDGASFVLALVQAVMRQLPGPR